MEWMDDFLHLSPSALSAVNPTALLFVRSTASVVGLDLVFQPSLVSVGLGPVVSGEY